MEKFFLDEHDFRDYVCANVFTTGQHLMLHASKQSPSSLLSRVSLTRVIGEFAVVNCEKSAHEVLLALALFKAGVPFLPIDASTPGTAVAFRVEDLGFTCTVFVSVRLLAARALDLRTSRAVLEIKVAELSVQKKRFSSPIVLRRKRDWFHAFFTSGSTGRPKAVLASQQAVGSYMTWHALCETQLSVRDSVLFSCSVSWDPSLFMRLWPLLAGGETCVLRNALNLETALLTSGCNVAFLTPSQASVLSKQHDFAHMLLLLFGGEALSVKLARRFSGVQNVWNVYGPTETVVVVTSFDAKRHALSPRTQNIPIGRPFHNNRVLTRALPSLAICGPQTHCAYSNRMLETRSKYLYDKFLANDGSQRLFVTGDVVEWSDRIAGCLTFVGRSDDQVKVNGQRVELRAVELALLQCVGIAEAAVFVNTREHKGQAQLCAALVASAGKHIDESQIRADLGLHLPRHEIPHKFIVLQSIPLTSTGKCDRKALHNLAFPSREKSAAFLRKSVRNFGAEKSNTSKSALSVVRSLFEETLGCHVKSAAETFWELGGTSLMAMKLNGLLQNAFGGLNISVPQLMRDGSVQGVAQWFEQQIERTSRSKIAAPRSPSFFARASTCQAGLFAVWKAAPTSRAYNLGGSFLRHRTVEELEHRFNVIARRHSALRCRRFFLLPNAVLLQEIDVEPGLIHCFKLGEHEKDAVDVLLSAESVRPWNLEDSALVRAFIFCDASQSELLMFYHHILSDAWSFALLREQFTDIVFTTQISEQPAQMWEIASFERTRNDLRDWWKKHLHGTRATKIPFKLAGAHRRSFAIPAHLQHLAAAKGVTKFALFQGIFARMIWRICCPEADHVLVVGPFALREDRLAQQVVGYLVNSVVFVYRGMSSTMSFDELLECSAKAIADTVTFGPLMPFPVLVRECEVEDAHELGRLMFHWMVGQDKLGGSIRTPEVIADLLFASDSNWLMAEARFSQIDSVAGNFLSLNNYVLGFQAERQEEEWAGPVMSSMPKTLQQAMGRLRGGRGRRRAGVALLCVQKANDVVGLHMERSELLIELVYGVMESGGAFLPLDSQYSREVVEFRLRDSGAAICMIMPQAMLSLAWPCCIASLLCDRISSCVCRSASSDVAYVMHTSGSTGAPKGAKVLQRNVTNLLDWSAVGEHLQLCHEDAFVWQSSISFDMLILDLLWPRMADCTVLCVRDGVERDTRDMAQLMQRLRASVLFVVPSHLSVLVSAGQLWCETMRLVIAGGEGLSEKLSEKAGRMRSTGLQVVNFYGPTETCVGIMSHLVKQERASNVSEGTGLVALGRPFPNTHNVTGANGSLHVTGSSVGGGYVNRAELTAKVFVYDHRRNDGRSKAYDTMDVARACMSGELLYEGRRDDQVKISGQRVELGAVENAILSCAGVQGCAVVVVESSAAMKSLAAVYVGTASVVQVQSELRRRGGLARHEMPQQVVRVDEIPLTRAGKADRRALREKIRAASTTTTDDMYRQQQQHQRQQQDEFVSPESRARSIVEEAFREVLGQQHKHSGKDLSFWELGGTSLMGMALDGVLQRKTGVKVGIGRLMRDGTVEAVAKIIAAEEQRDSGSGSGSVVSVHQHEDQRDYLSSPSPCMFWASASQAGLYVAWKMEQDPKNAYTVSQVFDVVAGRVDVGRVVAAVDELMQLHETLRTRFVEADGRVMQVVEGRAKSVESAVSSVVEVVDVADRDEGEMVARRAGQHAFDLQRGPMLRVVVVRVAGSKEDTSARSQPDMLVFVMPHICYDHGSERRLFGDFVKLYTGGREEARKLAPTNMREFAVWEQQMLAERGSRLEEFWRRHLEGAKLSRIPGTRAAPKGMMMMSEARVQSIRWSEQVGARVREWMRRGGWRQVSVLHATLAALIGRLTGDESVVLAIALSQRGFGGANENASANASLARSGSSVVGNGAVGYMMNVVWVRYAVGGALGRWASVADFVDDCQRRISEAFEHGDYPLALVWRAAGFGELGGEEVTVALDVVPEFPRDETGDVLRESGIEVPQLPPNMIQFSGELEGQTLGLAVNARAANFSDRSVSGWSLLVMWNKLLFGLTHQVSFERNFWYQGGCGAESAWRYEGEPSQSAVSIINGEWMRQQQQRHAWPVFARQETRADTVVGVRMEQSSLLMMVVYGIVGSGSAFLICEKDLATVAVLWRLEDAKADLCVVDEPWVALLSGRQMWASLASTATLKRKAPAHSCASDCAYVMYTSGTTGEAKGVRVGRHNLENYLSWHKQETFAGDIGVTALMSGTLSFDGNLTVLFWPAVCEAGGHVLMLNRQMIRDVGQVAKMVSEWKEQRWFLKLVPAFAALFVQSGAKLEQTIGVMLGGEAVTWSLAKLLYSAGAPFVWNEYGPTECTIAVCNQWANVERQRPSSEVACVAIGRPGAGSAVEIAAGKKAWIGGAQVSQGYLSRAQSRQAFVYDCSGNDGSGMMYDSGDHMTVTAEGTLLYEGRRDDQVKISGQRVELGAVENAILSCAGVQGCAVVVVESSAAMKSLAAVYVGTASVVQVQSELRRRGGLARHEMPQQVVRVDEIPLTRAGKADRRALREKIRAASTTTTDDMYRQQQQHQRQQQDEFVSPESRARSIVEEAFREVLGQQHKHSGKDLSFWELGGTSLMGMALDGVLQRKTGVKVGIGRLMRDGTVEGIAKFIQEHEAQISLSQRPERLIPATQARCSPAQPSFCRATAGQEGLYVIWRTDPLATNYNMLTTVPCPTSDGSAIERGLHSVTAMHAALRTRRVSEFNGTVLLEMRGAPAKTCLDVANVDSEADAKLLEWMEGLSSSWDLERGDGLMRATAVLWRGAGQTEATAAALMLVMHHIIGDEWSMQVVEQDLHRAWTQNEAPHVDSIRANSTLEMWDVAELEAQLLQERGDEMRTWWRRHLEGARVTRVPQKSATFAAGARRSKSVIREIPEGPRKRVQEAGRRAGVSVFAVWQGLFAWWQWRAFGSSQEQEQEEEEGEQQQQQKLGIGSSSTRGPSVLVVGPYGRRDDERGASHSRVSGQHGGLSVRRECVAGVCKLGGAGARERASCG
jgi:acyl-coenzyme A synthetase/AMP-(fatty) acid ligase